MCAPLCLSPSFRDICCSRTQPYQMTRFVPNGTKSIQITMQKEILSMRTKRADHQIQCVCLTKTDNRWTHACSKLYLLLFIFIFGFSLTLSLSFVLPHNLINENNIMREAKHSYFLVQSYSMYLVENVLAFALIKYGFIIFVYTYIVWAFLHETQTYIQLKMGILPFSMMDFGACTRLSAHQLKNQHLNVPYFSFSFFITFATLCFWLNDKFLMDLPNRQTAFTHKKIISHFESVLGLPLINNVVEIVYVSSLHGTLKC